MKNVLSALAIARQHIKANPIKKNGRNEFSKYDYFTPELVNKLVTDGCNEANLICIFNLMQDELGYYGQIILTEMESAESITTIMRTARPNITATNETQQMGGMNTYAKRYSLMSLFDIEDNTIDFDSQDHTKSKGTVKPLELEQPKLPWLNKFEKDKKTTTENWANVVAAIGKGYKLSDFRKKYTLSKDTASEIEGLVNALQPA